MRNEKHFALYRGDSYLCMGTLKEIAKEQGIKPESVRFFKSPSYQKRVRRYDQKHFLVEV